MIAMSAKDRTGKWVARLLLLAAAWALLPMMAHAVPTFARQTGQNCLACHAGGQFPELTPYGRMFKLTGYTIGQRGNPLSLMAVGTYTKTRNTNTLAQGGDPSSDFLKDGTPMWLNTGSLFIAGKVSDNVGGFVQLTYDNYDGNRSASDSHYKGHSHSDNLDIRYADRLITDGRDLIVGFSLHNNPTVQDVWNSVPAWGFNTVPGSSGIGPGVPAPILAGGLSQQAAGLGGYLYWNKTLYAELTAYQTANGVYSLMSQGFNADRGNQTILKGYNPYLRLALTHEWGAHNLMVGATGMSARVYPNAVDPRGPTDKLRDLGVDAQYQYLLSHHTVTAQASYIHERHTYDTAGPSATGAQCGAVDSTATDPAATTSDTYCNDFNNGDPTATGLLQPLTNAADTLNLLRAKLTYVYKAAYGGSLSYFNLTGTTNSALQTSTFDSVNGVQAQGTAGGGNQFNASGNPATSGWTYEAFWLPVQNVRVGAQYTNFTKFNGTSSNYDGFGRNAKDNNTLFLYLWAAY